MPDDRRNPIALAPPRHVRGNRIDFSGNLHPGDQGEWLALLIFATHQQKIGEVQTAGPHPDADLPLVWVGHWLMRKHGCRRLV
jgi:hypothetical protein